MTNHKTNLGALVTCAAVMLMLETVALAQPTAEDLYLVGQEAYNRADYAAAIENWRAAYDLSQESGFLFNLAQAQRLKGDCKDALSTYRNFIVKYPTADQRQLAEELERELETECGDKPKITDPGTPKRASTPESPAIRPNLVFGLNEPQHNDSRRGKNMKYAGLAIGGVGVATLVTGLVIGNRARSIGEKINWACATSCDWNDYRDEDARGRSYTAAGYAMDVVGLAAIAGGATLYYVGHRQAAITVSPQTRQRGAVVTWEGAW